MIQRLDLVEAALQVDHRALLPLIVDHQKRRDASRLGDTLIVCTEGRCDVYDTSTILGADIVTRDDTKGTLARIDPRDELLVVDTDEIATLAS